MGAPERKYTDADVRADDELVELAHEYVEAYFGDFEPLVHARLALEYGRTLTTVEVRKVLNCMRNDWKYADKMPAPKATIIQMPDREERLVTRKQTRRRREPTWEERNQPCGNTDLHRPHSYEGAISKYMNCDGVNNGRRPFNMDAEIRVPYAVARGGKMVHIVARTARFAYFPDAYGWGYSFDGYAKMGMTEGPDLYVELVCRYPGWIKKPVLLTAEQAMQVVDKTSQHVPLCKHCEKETS